MKLMTIDDAMGMSRSQLRKTYSDYANPGFVKLLGLVNIDRHFVRASGVSIWDEDGAEFPTSWAVGGLTSDTTSEARRDRAREAVPESGKARSQPVRGCLGSQPRANSPRRAIALILLQQWYRGC